MMPRKAFGQKIKNHFQSRFFSALKFYHYHNRNGESWNFHRERNNLYILFLICGGINIKGTTFMCCFPGSTFTCTHCWTILATSLYETRNNATVWIKSRREKSVRCCLFLPRITFMWRIKEREMCMWGSYSRKSMYVFTVVIIFKTRYGKILQNLKFT